MNIELLSTKRTNMSKPTEQELKEFANALQLSIQSRIASIAVEGGDVMIRFSSPPEVDDVNLYNFFQLFGSWSENKKNYIISTTDKINWPKITLFLLLTRMDGGNIRKLAELDEFENCMSIFYNAANTPPAMPSSTAMPLRMVSFSLRIIAAKGNTKTVLD